MLWSSFSTVSSSVINSFHIRAMKRKHDRVVHDDISHTHTHFSVHCALSRRNCVLPLGNSQMKLFTAAPAGRVDNSCPPETLTINTSSLLLLCWLSLHLVIVSGLPLTQVHFPSIFTKPMDQCEVLRFRISPVIKFHSSLVSMETKSPPQLLQKYLLKFHVNPEPINV